MSLWLCIVCTVRCFGFKGERLAHLYVYASITNLHLFRATECQLPSTFDANVVGVNCTKNGTLVYGTSCTVACADGYDATTATAGLNVYTCSPSGSVLTANATLDCRPRMSAA